MNAVGLVHDTTPTVTEEHGSPPTRPPATPEAGRAPKRATLTLELAGRALDPTTPEALAPEAARILFREAILQAARFVSEPGTPRLTFDEALAVLDRGRHLTEAGVSLDTIRVVLSDTEVTPTAVVLRELELPLTRVVQSAIGTPTLARAERRRTWALRAFAGLTALVVVAYGAFYLATASFPYRASSAHSGFPTQGHIGRTHAYGLVVHTQQEKEPWVEIDLESERTISAITLKNRADCCAERGLPLIVEVAGSDKAWKQLGLKTEKFDQWVLHFPPQSARYLRLRSTANTVLQFRDIQVE